MKYIASLRQQSHIMRVRLPEKTQLFVREIPPCQTITINLSPDEEKAVIEHLRAYGGRALSEFAGYRADNRTIKTPFVYHDQPISYDSVQIGVDLVKQTAQEVANDQLADSTAKTVKATEQRTGKALKGQSGVVVADEQGEVIAEVTK